MTYRLVIFDFDGTLADTFTWFTGVLNRVAEKHSFETVHPEEIETLRTCDVRQLLEHVGVPLWKVPLIGATLHALMAEDADRIPLFAGVQSLLERLAARGITVAVVSSNSCANIRRILGPENAARIGFYECGVSIFGKAERLRKVLRNSGIPRGEAIYIGDEIRDLEAARKARVAFGAVSWGYNRLHALEARSPDEVFASFEEIGERIAGAPPPEEA